MSDRVNTDSTSSEVGDRARRLAMAVAALGMTMGVAPSVALATAGPEQAMDTQTPMRLATNYYKIEYDSPSIESAPPTSQVKPVSSKPKPVLPKDSKPKPTELPGDMFDAKSRQSPGQYPPQ